MGVAKVTKRMESVFPSKARILFEELGTVTPGTPSFWLTNTG